jgi:CheY-like chemotaxis protein
MADGGQIEQVLMNLAANARDAMPNGGLLLIQTERVLSGVEGLTQTGQETPAHYALISVSDTGAGIDKPMRERIFEPFFTTKEVGRGTGLGLSMAYGIIKQHNGEIYVYSEKGKGTTFKIYLPLLQTDEDIKEESAEITVPGKGVETILVAEDDADVRSLTKSILESSGYTVVEAMHGEDAIRTFNQNKETIDLLLLDVVMPQKDGREVYEEIKMTKPDIKVVFISGYAADILHQKGIIDAGLTFVSKPILPEELLRTVRAMLDQQES